VKGPDASITLAKKVADRLLAELPAADWSHDATFAAGTRNVDLPIRDEVPQTTAAAQQQFHAAVARLNARRNGTHGEKATLAEIKRLSETVELLSYLADGGFTAWTGLTVEQLHQPHFSHPLFAMRLGDAVILGLASEPFGTYSIRLRDAQPHIRLIVSEQCNGWLGYIPTAEDYPAGGYEVCCALTSPAVDEALTQAATALIHDVAGLQ